MKDASRALEKRSEDDITVEPHIKTAVLASHDWVGTCHRLDVNLEQTPFPHANADEILEKADEHKQFIPAASAIKTTAKQGLFTKDDKWDDWAKSFEECMSLPPGSTGIPLSCII